MLTEHILKVASYVENLLNIHPRCDNYTLVA